MKLYEVLQEATARWDLRRGRWAASSQLYAHDGRLWFRGSVPATAYSATVADLLALDWELCLPPAARSSP